MVDSTNKRLRILRDQIIESGGTVTEITRNRHIKIRFVNPKGIRQVLIVAVSPSGETAINATLGQLRRKLKAEEPVRYASLSRRSLQPRV